MQKLSKELKIWLYASFILTGLAVALLTASILTGYEPTGYIKPSIVYSVVKALTGVTVAIAILSIFSLPKGVMSGDSPLSFPVIFPSVFFAIIMFSGGVILLGGSVLGISPIAEIFKGFNYSGVLIVVLGAIFSFLSVVYLILNCFPQEGSSKQSHTLVGFSLPISSLLWVAISYFDMDVSMNAPIKNFTHLTLLAFMLWSLYELRSMTGNPMPRIYFSVGLIVIFLSGLSSLPWLIGCISGQLTDPAYPSYILYNLISLAIFAYSTVRVTVFVLARDLYERIADQTPPETFEEEEN